MRKVPTDCMMCVADEEELSCRSWKVVKLKVKSNKWKNVTFLNFIALFQLSDLL